MCGIIMTEFTTTPSLEPLPGRYSTTAGAQRIDLVEVALPTEFRSQSLETITVKDTGRFNFQRAILWAVTVR